MTTMNLNINLNLTNVVRMLVNTLQAMKKLTIYLVICIAISACQEPVKTYEAPKRKFKVVARNGTGIKGTYSIVYCDSFQFKSSKHAIIYVDGTEMELFADNKIHVSDSK